MDLFFLCDNAVDIKVKVFHFLTSRLENNKFDEVVQFMTKMKMTKTAKAKLLFAAWSKIWCHLDAAKPVTLKERLLHQRFSDTTILRVASGFHKSWLH